MSEETLKLSIPRLLLGLAGALFVAALALAGGMLIVLGTKSEAYLNLEKTLERFVGN